MPRLISLTFNLDPTVQDGSLVLRQSSRQPAPWPEWRRGQSGGAADSPVAYVLSELGAAPPRLGVELERQNGDPEHVQVRALPGTGTRAPLPPPVLLPPDLLWPGSHWFSSVAEYQAAAAYRAYYDVWQDSRQVDPHVLGPVPPTDVRFTPGRPTARALVPLANAQLRGRGVGVFDVGWRWQTRQGPDRAWQDVGQTHHRVYTVLAPPTLPWHALAHRRGDTQVAWVEALDVACRWAAGARDSAGVAGAVTQAVNGLGAGQLEYGCPVAALSMYASPFGVDVFDCSAFLELLEGRDGNGRFVNCTDCATIVSTFANLLGCDLWQSRMGSYWPPFLTNPLVAIGTGRLGSPCGWGLGFTFHEVAWEGACGQDDEVHDACVRLLTDVEESGLPTLTVPSGIRFGANGDGQYRDLIAAPSDRDICVPRPAERRRRALV